GINWAGAGLPLRNEFEFTYRFKSTNSIDATNQATGVVQSGDMEIKSHNYMMNTYYDIDIGDSITPYVGFGLGLSRNSVEVDTVLGGVAQNFASDESTNFAWSLNAGASYYMTPEWALDFGYRYISLGKIRTVDGIGANVGRRFEHGTIKSHDLSLGVRYGF
ncbi:MAG: outer membrane beta-barrel protein, partial [Proteobacteria bacterium]|nr:outer membrane beta-barrel protein [Pseudomonadota bacterium]